MKLYAIRIFTADWEKALAFYRDTLGLTLKFNDEALGWAEFDVGGPSLGLERATAGEGEVGDGATGGLVGRFLGISLQVDDIADVYRSLSAKGVNFLAPPEKQPWGGSLAHFEDPDRNILTLLGS